MKNKIEHHTLSQSRKIKTKKQNYRKLFFFFCLEIVVVNSKIHLSSNKIAHRKKRRCGRYWMETQFLIFQQIEHQLGYLHEFLFQFIFEIFKLDMKRKIYRGHDFNQPAPFYNKFLGWICSRTRIGIGAILVLVDVSEGEFHFFSF